MSRVSAIATTRASTVVFRFALALLVLAPTILFAKGPCTTPSPDCVVVGEWDMTVSLGLGARTNPVAGYDDIPLIVVPQLSYYGKRFFLNNLEIGFTAYERTDHTINVIATPGYDRVFFVRYDPQNFFVGGSGAVGEPPPPQPQPPPPEPEPEVSGAKRPRQWTYLVGPEWLFDAGRVTGQVSALYEATGRHDGYEVRAAIATPLIQFTGSLVLSCGVTWKSAQLVDYYYGVADYEGDAALNAFAKLGFSYPLSERWALNAFVHYEHLGSGITDSPIVNEKAVTTAFAGVVLKLF